MKFVGRSGANALFVYESLGIVVDEEVNLVVEKGHANALIASAQWDDTQEHNPVSAELAQASVTDLDIHIFSANDRLYTIPKAVQAEARRGLEWRKKHGRGGTPVGLNTARTLAAGGQIGIKKIRHIAKYFPRHEVDKKGKGYKPGEAGFPSNGRIAWALWGGNSAQRWAQSIVERDSKQKTVTAGGIPIEYMPPKQYDLDSFRDAQTMPDDAAPEFLCRVRLDGTGIDRLYMVSPDDILHVWDDSAWDDFGDYEIDLNDMDGLLDEEDDTVPIMWVPVDAESALKIAAMLDSNPSSPMSLHDIDREEADLALEAAPVLDWAQLDDVLTAAGGKPSSDASQNHGDGQYTPKERSANASRQVRDASGKFAKQGSRVVVGGDTKSRGVITKINPGDQTVSVKLDSGKTIDVPGTATQSESKFVEPQQSTTSPVVPPSATAGILGQPRVASDQPNVRIPGMLPPLTGNSISLLLNDWPAWVAAERELYNQTAPTGPENVQMPQYDLPEQPDNIQVQNPLGGTRNISTRPRTAPNAYNHPMLRDWLNQRTSGGSYPNRGWYNPIVTRPVIDPRRFSAGSVTAAGETPHDKDSKETLAPKKEASSPAATPGKAVELTPETSDVPPVYMAIVAQDDPQAVMDLISLIPVSTKSTVPTVFKREPGKWIKDDSILADLNSPTPPPVVVLDDKMLDAVMDQIDGDEAVAASAFILDRRLTGLWLTADAVAAIVAAGGLDQNRGNAEKLRRYWTVGKGGAKIRWGTGGDWKRCVRHLSKYLGPRAKGYCNLRHKEMLGMYPATHAKALHEHSMEQPLYIEVPEEDLKMPLEAIHAEDDRHFDYKWEPDEEIIEIIRELSEDTILAAGGLDQNRGNAEKLRRYWTVGKGGAKIRWNTKGDWTRCVRHLSKYLGPRAKGYCALRHKEMTGMWTGDSAHRKMYGRKHFSVDSSVIESEDAVIAAAERRAVAEAGVYEINSNSQSQPSEERTGATFFIPLVIPEMIESGDGRKFVEGAIDMRELPLPLMWQIKSGPGHDGSVVVGKITHMERTKDGIGHAYGVFDTGPYGSEAERLVRGGFIRGVSADLDRFEADEEPIEASEEDNRKIGTGKISITKARVMAVTLVPKPAFQECRIEIVPDTIEQEEPMVTDGVYYEDVDPADAESIVACGMVAGAIPVNPPVDWFENPKLTGPTPLTVDDQGRVFGHIAAWHVDHIGMSFGTRPPRSASNYAYFHTGVVRAEDGSDIPVGQLTLAGGHASLNATAAEAVRHYDDTASAIADVHAGEDSHGIWVAGALRPGTSPEQIRALRASAPSGDWRPIKGKLELVAVCQVNVPGFPIARARVASGEVLALVAAGASMLAKMKTENPIEDLSSRIEALEKTIVSSAAESAKAKFAALKAEAGVDTVTAAGSRNDMLAQMLSVLLADNIAMSHKIQGYHWNVVGDDFTEYHSLFSSIYEDVDGAIDALAENIRKLGYPSPYSITDVESLRTIPDSGLSVSEPRPMVADLLDSNEIFIEALKDAFDMADSAREQGIANFLADRLDMHQKWAWQLASSLDEDSQMDEYDSASDAFEAVFSTLQDEGLIASANAYNEFGGLGEDARKKLAEEGKALPDGSFPIRNVSDLRNAIHAYGRSNEGDRAKVRRHIMKRADSLHKTDIIPDNWKAASAIEARVASLMADDGEG